MMGLLPVNSRARTTKTTFSDGTMAQGHKLKGM